MAGPLSDSPLLAILEEARTYGFLGPGPLETHLSHARGFARGWSELRGPQAPHRLADLGSGGGVPGLVLAEEWPASEVVLIESNARRVAFLTQSIQQLQWARRVTVAHVRAEEFAQDRANRGTFPLVTARSFGPPSPVAECGAPLLDVGGLLLVSEPPPEPGGPSRWPGDGLAQLGLEADVAGEFEGFRFQALRLVSLTPERFPRRTGVPRKRPLF
jgi:16S rRNA (guanine527-N7)-methyltransferase